MPSGGPFGSNDDFLINLGTWAAASYPKSPALSLYEQAMVRVLPEYVEDSLLLKKPSGQHHYGNQIDGFDTSLVVGSAGRADYDMFVNWIAEGANCGIDPGCP